MCLPIAAVDSNSVPTVVKFAEYPVKDMFKNRAVVISLFRDRFGLHSVSRDVFRWGWQQGHQNVGPSDWAYFMFDEGGLQP